MSYIMDSILMLSQFCFGFVVITKWLTRKGLHSYYTNLQLTIMCYMDLILSQYGRGLNRNVPCMEFVSAPAWLIIIIIGRGLSLNDQISDPHWLRQISYFVKTAFQGSNVLVQVCISC